MRRRKARGFSLVEILVSVLIISLAFVAFSQLFISAIWLHKKAQYQTAAAKRAQNEVERAIYLGDTTYSTLLNPTTTNAIITSSCYPSGYTVSSATMAHQFQRTVSFSMSGLPGGSGSVVYTANPFNYTRGQDAKDQELASVVVTITWSGFRANMPNQSVTLTSFIAQMPQGN